MKKRLEDTILLNTYDPTMSDREIAIFNIAIEIARKLVENDDFATLFGERKKIS